MVKSRKKETEGMNPNGLNDRTPSPSSGSEEVTKLPSNDVFSSYIFSTSSRSLSKYGERLLMEVISVAQEYTYDAALGINKLNFSQKYQEKFAVIDIPVKNLRPGLFPQLDRNDAGLLIDRHPIKEME